MAGSSFGTLFRVTTWGESHGEALGAVVDGCPAGLELCEEDIQKALDRRKPGQNKFTTARVEKDKVRILSGIFEGKTTGTPISMIVFNEDQRSRDYGEIASYYRPGHADLTFDQKYGFRDYRGGGRSSGRETIGRVMAGAIAKKLLARLGIKVTAWTGAIGSVEAFGGQLSGGPLPTDLSWEKTVCESPLYMPDPEAEKKASAYLEECAREGTSAGGRVDCLVRGMIPGAGEPVFDKLDAELGKALFSIGAVKAVEIGEGIKAASLRGHEMNDMFGEEGKLSNHAGGIYGGISDGSDISIRVSFKPTPSISREQQALFADGSVKDISIKGRHDPVIVPRAVVVVECMTAIAVLDLLLRNMAARTDDICRFYNR